MAAATPNSFWQFDSNYWFNKLNSSASGLTKDAAEEILKQTVNPGKARSRFLKDTLLFLGQFKSPLMWLLIGAVIISAFLGDTSDVLIILFIVVSTGLLSFIQERNAGRVVEKLQSMIALKSMVFRDGTAEDIVNSTVVTGDIIEFNAGDMVPADCLLTEANELFVNEASLTGESFPVAKQTGIVDEKAPLNKRSNCVWEGTNIVSGTAKGLVISTGTQTIFGSIVQSASQNIETSFEKGIRDFGYFLMRITLILSVFILDVNLLNHKSVIESALFALALAVGMAPELLPAITTIAMSAGAKRMLAKKVIVKKLSSIQNLGEVNLLCTDKTGTITEGTIDVQGIVDNSGNENEYVKTLAFWNADMQLGYSNAIDSALKLMTIPGVKKPQKIGEIPYDFIRKRLSIAVDTGTEKILICKGAFSEITAICTQIRISGGTIKNFAEYQQAIEKQYEDYGVAGTRVIALCYKSLTQNAIKKDDEREMVLTRLQLLAKIPER